jgi:hypothetical protein
MKTVVRLNSVCMCVHTFYILTKKRGYRCLTHSPDDIIQKMLFFFSLCVIKKANIQKNNTNNNKFRYCIRLF